VACPEIPAFLERSRGTWAASFLFILEFVGISPTIQIIAGLHEAAVFHAVGFQGGRSARPRAKRVRRDEPFADLASRGRLQELRTLARQVDITPIRLPIPAAFIELLGRFVAKFGPNYATPEALRQRMRAAKPAPFALPSQGASATSTPASPLHHPSWRRSKHNSAARSKASADLGRGLGRGLSSDVTGGGPKPGGLRCWYTGTASSGAFPKSSAGDPAAARRIPFFQARLSRVGAEACAKPALDANGCAGGRSQVFA
jgi:hypothetical protein